MAKKKRVAAVRKNIWSTLKPGRGKPHRALAGGVPAARGRDLSPARRRGARQRSASPTRSSSSAPSASRPRSSRRGVKRGDVVSAMLPNVPAMLDAHYGVPMLGAVLNTINTRLDADTVAYILEHGEAKVFITDRVFAGVVGPALKKLKKKPFVIDVDDPLYTGPGDRHGDVEYEQVHRRRRARTSPGRCPRSEDDPIALNYTSGTTGPPQGRGLSPPRHVPRVARQHRGLGDAGASGVPVDAAVVPLQRLVLSRGR